MPAPAPAYSLAELAERFGLELRGDGGVRIGGVATLAGAGPGELAFLANPRYRRDLTGTAASAVVLAAADADASPAPCLVAPSPYAAFARIAALFDPAPALQPGIHPSAAIAPDAVVDPGAVLGADGFGLAMDAGRWIKVPQRGGVIVGDDAEIGANTTIDRGALEDTVLEEDVRLDNQIQIGHGVRVGAHTAMAGCVAVAGSSRIGRHCLIGGGAGIVGHIELCDRVVVSAMSLVTRSITEPGEYSSALPAQDARSWRRTGARLRQLDDLARKLSALTKDSG